MIFLWLTKVFPECPRGANSVLKKSVSCGGPQTNRHTHPHTHTHTHTLIVCVYTASALSAATMARDSAT